MCLMLHNYVPVSLYNYVFCLIGWLVILLLLLLVVVVFVCLCVCVCVRARARARFTL